MQVAHPLGRNNRKHPDDATGCSLHEANIFIAALPIHPTAPCSLRPGIPSSFSLDVVILTPRIKNGRFPYRDKVRARVSLHGNVPLPFDGGVLGPALDESWLRALQWLCYAECQSCRSRNTSAHQMCNPIAFHLHPMQELDHNQNSALDRTGDSFTLTRNVTFEIKTRRRKPSAEDQEWRCPSELLL